MPGDKDKGLGDKRGCEAGGGGDGILPDGSDAELQQELGAACPLEQT